MTLAGGGRQARTILVVEDDPDIRDILAIVLGEEGYAVVTASNGREALERLESTPSPCLILLDLMMPVMSGWQFRERQRSDPRFSEIPVVVVSAGARAAVEAAAMDASDFIAKPLEIERMLEVVGRVCAR